MKKLLGLTMALVLVAVLGGAALAASIIDKGQSIDPFTLDEQKAGKVFLDIRANEDIWNSGEIEGSLRINLYSLLASTKLPAKNAAIVVVSEDGSAGEMAVLALTKMGYTNVKNLEGGIAAWKMMGFPTKEVQRTDKAPVAGGC